MNRRTFFAGVAGLFSMMGFKPKVSTTLAIYASRGYCGEGWWVSPSAKTIYHFTMIDDPMIVVDDPVKSGEELDPIKVEAWWDQVQRYHALKGLPSPGECTVHHVSGECTFLRAVK